MAESVVDIPINLLPESLKIGDTDLIVIQRGEEAVKASGATLKSWLYEVSQAHGMIQSIDKVGTADLVDTYRITLADGTHSDFTVTNGARGPRGYKGDPPAYVSGTREYQVSDSGTEAPTGEWLPTIPNVPQGKYLWIRSTETFETGTTQPVYSVTRAGMDGSGSVSSVSDISPDANGNVALTAADVGALPSTGGDVTGEIKMDGNPISGLGLPTSSTQATNKEYVDAISRKAAPRNLLDNSDFRNPVNQRGQTSYSSGYSVDRWHLNTSNVNVIVGSGKITLKKSVSGGLFSQIVPVSLAGAQLTLAIKTSLGLLLNSFLLDGEHMSRINELPAYFGVRVQSGRPEVYIYFPNNAESVEFDLYWAALYEGDYTADTLPEYKPKGYGAELAECQRYYIHLGKVWRYADKINGFGLMAPVTCPVSMRMTPTVVGNSHRIFTSAGWKDVTLSSVALMSKNEFLLKLSSTEELENGATYLYEGVEALSADL